MQCERCSICDAWARDGKSPHCQDMCSCKASLRLMCGAAGAADRPVQDIKINNVVIHANPLAGA